MDLEQIKRINREALRAAQEAEGSSVNKDDNQMTMYLVAVAAGVVTYLLLQYYNPTFVQSTVDENGMLSHKPKKFDPLRGIVVSVVVGLLVILAFHLFKKD